MSLTRGFTRWFGQFVHIHHWGPWRVRRLMIDGQLMKVRQCEGCGQEQAKPLTAKELSFWE